MHIGIAIRIPQQQPNPPPAGPPQLINNSATPLTNATPAPVIQG